VNNRVGFLPQTLRPRLPAKVTARRTSVSRRIPRSTAEIERSRRGSTWTAPELSRQLVVPLPGATGVSAPVRKRIEVEVRYRFPVRMLNGRPEEISKIGATVTPENCRRKESRAAEVGPELYTPDNTRRVAPGRRSRCCAPHWAQKLLCGASEVRGPRRSSHRSHADHVIAHKKFRSSSKKRFLRFALRAL